MVARQKPKHLQRFVPKESAIVESTRDPSCKTQPGREGMLSYRKSHQLPVPHPTRASRPLTRTKSTNALNSMVFEPRVSDPEMEFVAPWESESSEEWDMSPINPDDQPQLISESMYFEGFDWDWREEAWRRQQAAQAEPGSTTESAGSSQSPSVSATQDQDRDQNQGPSEPQSDLPRPRSRPRPQAEIPEDDSEVFGTSEHVEYAPEAAETPAHRSPRRLFRHFYFS